MLRGVAEWEIPWEDLHVGERIGIGKTKFFKFILCDCTWMGSATLEKVSVAISKIKFKLAPFAFLQQTYEQLSCFKMIEEKWQTEQFCMLFLNYVADSSYAVTK